MGATRSFGTAGQALSLVTVAVLALLHASAAPATSFGMLLIDDSSGGIDFFAAPSLNDRGRIAYRATFDVGGGQGLFTGAPGESRTAVATSAGSFGKFGGPSINDAGSVSFSAWRDDGAPGVYKWRGGTLTQLAARGGAMDFIDFSGTGSINNHENVVFEGWTGSHGAPGVGAGIFATFPLAVGEVAHTAKDVYTGFGTGSMDINDRGQVAFYATGGDPTVGATKGIYREGIGGGAVTIADNRSGSLFESFGTDVESINASNTVAFIGLPKSGGAGVYTGSGGAINKVADSAGAFRYFDDPRVNDAGSVAFAAELDNGATGVYTGADPSADKLIAVGDPLFGSTVTKVAPVIDQNDAGMIAFIANLADSREVLVRADPIGASPFFAALAQAGTGTGTSPLTYRFTCPTCLASTHAAGLGNAVPIYLELPVSRELRFGISGDRVTRLLLPAGVGGPDGLIEIIAGDQHMAVAAGSEVDVTGLAPGGLDAFTLAGLDFALPGSSDAVSSTLMQGGFTFASGGLETVVTVFADVPEPLTLLISLPGLLAGLRSGVIRGRRSAVEERAAFM